tara:strand:- start:2361 stop:2939 length:579 start_codon:yes stop_codon:yes gene_type:complete
MTEFWDFDENVNFSPINGYKVLNVYPDAAAAAKILNELKFITYRAFMSIRNTENITPEIVLLLNTPFRLQEMQLEAFQGRVLFEGLNKPRDVYTKQNVIPIGKDGNLRAKYRVIFLTIRYKNKNLKKIKNILPLLSHELTHTALNHVKWRDDDHGKHFNEIDKMILKHLRLKRINDNYIFQKFFRGYYRNNL